MPTVECYVMVDVTAAVPAIKSEATAIFAPQDGHWKITVSFDGRRFCVPKFCHYTNRLLDFGSLERLIKQTGKSCVHKITANYLVQIE